MYSMSAINQTHTVIMLNGCLIYGYTISAQTNLVKPKLIIKITRDSTDNRSGRSESKIINRKYILNAQDR